jgi:phosphatidylglycerol:prolipoprotein diacylglycerol transferase
MINYPIIDPVALSLGPLKVHWYGLTYLGGLLFASELADFRRCQFSGCGLLG